MVVIDELKAKLCQLFSGNGERFGMLPDLLHPKTSACAGDLVAFVKIGGMNDDFRHGFLLVAASQYIANRDERKPLVLGSFTCKGVS
jgi:hypothetical protein